MIAAYANQRPEDDSRQQTGIQWAEGQEADERRADRARRPDGYETRVYFGEKSPTLQHRRPAARRGAGRVRPAQGRPQRRRATRRRTTATAGVPIGNLFEPAALRGEVQRAQPAAVEPRARELARSSTTATRAQMVEKVAPWLTVDSDPYPAVVDGRIQWILDGYTVTDKYPLSQRESLEDDDRRLAAGEHRLPDAADRRDQLPAQLGQGDRRRLRRHGDALRVGRGRTRSSRRGTRSSPTSSSRARTSPTRSWSTCATPRTCSRPSATSSSATTRPSASDVVRGLDAAGRSRATRSARRRLQPPYRLFTDTGDGETWSLTSRLRAARRRTTSRPTWRSTATRPATDYGKISVLAAAQRAHRAVRCRSPTTLSHRRGRAARRCCPSRPATPTAVPGNLLTLPVGDTLHVRPAALHQALGRRVDLPDPAVRAGLLRGQRRHRRDPARGHRRLADLRRRRRTGPEPVRDPTDEPSPTEGPSAEPSQSPGSQPTAARGNEATDPRAARSRRRPSSPRPTQAQRQRRHGAVGPADGAGPRGSSTQAVELASSG